MRRDCKIIPVFADMDSTAVRPGGGSVFHALFPHGRNQVPVLQHRAQ